MNQEYHGIPFTPQQLKERRVELERVEMFKGCPNRDTMICEGHTVRGSWMPVTATYIQPAQKSIGAVFSTASTTVERQPFI